MTEEEAEYQARVATAQAFNLPLWIVDVNHICTAKDVEWFIKYGEEDYVAFLTRSSGPQASDLGPRSGVRNLEYADRGTSYAD